MKYWHFESMHRSKENGLPYFLHNSKIIIINLSNLYGGVINVYMDFRKFLPPHFGILLKMSKTAITN